MINDERMCITYRGDSREPRDEDIICMSSIYSLIIANNICPKRNGYFPLENPKIRINAQEYKIFVL